MGDGLLRVSRDGWVARQEIVAIARPTSPPVQALLERYEREGKLLDLTGGRPVRAVIFTRSGRAVLSPHRPETLVRRFLELEPDSDSD